LISIEVIQQFLDQQSTHTICPKFAQSFGQTISRYFLIVDCLRQLVTNSFPDVDGSNVFAWTNALLVHFEQQGGIHDIKIPLVGEGGTEFAGFLPGQEYTVSAKNIIVAINLAVRMPLEFSRDADRRINGWSFAPEYTIFDRAGLRRWEIVHTYVKGESIPTETSLVRV
jgi:hypothetical protein